MNIAENITIILYIIGIIAFAASGSFKGMKHQLDIFGVIVLGIITALGGGILRDVLINKIPFALLNEHDLYFSIGASLIAYFFGNRIHDYTEIIKYFDAAGLALFTVIGAQKGIEAGLGPLGIIMMGTLTGVAGGMIRDMLVCEIPFVLKEEVYALFCVFGTLGYILLQKTGMNPMSASWITIAFIFIGRVIAIRFNLHIPKRRI